MKKGFTLVELLAVITILAIILGFVASNTVAILSKIDKENYEKTVYVIEENAKIYGRDENIFEGETIGSVYCITLEMLDEKELINLPITDPYTNEEIDSNSCVMALNGGNDTIFYEFIYGKDTPSYCFDFNKTTKEIEDYNNGCPKDVLIPYAIDGVEVEVIGYQAFQSKEINSVSFKNGIKEINSYAFRDNKIKKLELPYSIEYIGTSAFAINEITDLYIPESVWSISKSAFNNNKLPDNEAFIYERNLDGSEDKTTLISYGGAKLVNIEIPTGVTTIDEDAFYNETFGVYCCDPIKVSDNSIKSIILPEGVTNIEIGSFYGNELTSITIPNSVTTIKSEAFAENLLTSITIPNSVISIGISAFESNRIPQGSATIDNTSGMVTIGSNAFRYNGPLGNTTITPVYLR